VHELSIALALVESVSEHVVAHGGGRVRGVTLRIGALSGVEVPALRFAFPEATAGTLLAGAALEVEEVPAVGFCPCCGEERVLPSVQRLRCAVCRTPMPRIVRGRELEILAVEVETSP
jgi:hydrogenase nickel incorporation protein HypA/HybF